jgi:hypothetical protein
MNVRFAFVTVVLLAATACSGDTGVTGGSAPVGGAQRVVIKTTTD